MNPSVPQVLIDGAYEEDPSAAAAEYGAEFRSDLEAYVTQEIVDSCTIPERFELPPVSGICYAAFVDPSGGSADSMTLAIAHAEGSHAVLDLTREVRPPFSPEAVVTEFSEDLKRYGILETTGDRYAGEWPRERFLVHGIHYRISDLTKSQIYQAALPMLNSHRVELLDNKRLRTQVLGLERRTARGGKDSIDHRPGGHDDLINSALGALSLCEVNVVPITRDHFGVQRLRIAQDDLEAHQQIWIRVEGGSSSPHNSASWAEEQGGSGPAYFLPLR
ncbi:MAG: hypothetical protein ACREXM_18490 [Gammaproteobacteria bacterium]